MVKTIKKDKLREMMGQYLDKTKIHDVKDGGSTVLVKAPVESGLSTFIDVENLPKSFDDFPYMPERLRDFAFRFGCEYRTHKQWAKEYKVNIATIVRWLAKDDIQKIIALARYERRMWLFGSRLQLERKTYSIFNKLLDLKVTPENISTILSTAKFVYQMLTDPSSVGSRGKESVNVSIGFGGPDVPNPYAKTPEERNVTPEELSNLKEEIKYLEHMEADLAGGKN